MRVSRVVVLAAANAALATPLLAQSNQQFVSQLLPNSPAPIAVDTIFGDFDGDADTDLVLVAATGPRIYRNDGSMTFTEVTGAFPLLAANMRTAAFVDVDGNQRRELLMTWDGQPRLFENLPGDVWQEISNRIPTGLPTIHGATAVDVDNDGDEDLACAGHWLTGGQNQLLTNDGTGNFTASQPFPGTSFQVLAADVDLDGDSDLFLSRDGFRLWRNDGGGAFTDVTATQLPAGLGSPTSMAAGDVDSDGFVDLLVSQSALGDLLLPNVGGGIFGTRLLTTPQPSAFTLTTALVDVDLDGDLDWPRGTINYGLPTLWLGSGFGIFTDASFRLPAATTLACQLRANDLDGDGDPDLVMTGLATAPQVMWNRHRHVAVSVAPTVGGVLGLELSSQPGYGADGRIGLVGLSLGRFDPLVPFPPFGMLGIDPGQIAWLGFAAYGATLGVTPFAIPVPAQPQFVGLPLYVQGLVDEQPAGVPQLTALVGTVVL